MEREQGGAEAGADGGGGADGGALAARAHGQPGRRGALHRGAVRR